MNKMTNLWTKNVDISLLFLILAVSISDYIEMSFKQKKTERES